MEADYARHADLQPTSFLLEKQEVNVEEAEESEEEEAFDPQRTQPKLVNYVHRIGGKKQPI